MFSRNLASGTACLVIGMDRLKRTRKFLTFYFYNTLVCGTSNHYCYCTHGDSVSDPHESSSSVGASVNVTPYRAISSAVKLPTNSIMRAEPHFQLKLDTSSRHDGPYVACSVQNPL